MASSWEVTEQAAVLVPHLAILDIRLVKEDGLEVFIEIRGDHPGQPVILCKAYDSCRSDRRAFAAEAYVVTS